MPFEYQKLGVLVVLHIQIAKYIKKKLYIMNRKIIKMSVFVRKAERKKYLWHAKIIFHMLGTLRCGTHVYVDFTCLSRSLKCGVREEIRWVVEINFFRVFMACHMSIGHLISLFSRKLNLSTRLLK